MENKNEVVAADPIRDMSTVRNEIKAMADFIATNLEEGKDKDFWTIPGTDKPTLLQPGAQKIMFYLAMYPTFTQMRTIEDFDKGLFHYSYKCELFSKKTNYKLGESIGNANSRESNFVRAMATKKTNVESMLNTIEKMAQKRAFVGAVINASRGVACGKFTQDLEDEEHSQPAQQNGKREIGACSVCGKAITQAEYVFSTDKYKKCLCIACQKKERVGA